MNDTVIRMNDTVTRMNKSVTEIDNVVTETNNVVTEMNNIVIRMNDTVIRINDIVTKTDNKFPQNSKQNTETTNKSLSILPQKREISKSFTSLKVGVNFTGFCRPSSSGRNEQHPAMSC